MPAITTIKLRRGTSAQWASANPVLAAGEIGLETDTLRTKYGNGTQTWTNLSYSVADASGTSSVDWTSVLNKPTTFPPSAHTHAISDVTGLQTALDGKAATVHSHAISDVTGLQTALDGKQDTITGAATTITSSNLTASRALASDGSGKVAVSSVTSTELGHLSGVTSAIQTQLNNKADLTYPVIDVSTNYAIQAGDVYDTIRSTGSAITITIDDVLTANGQYINFAQYGTGQITFTPGSGVTLNSVDNKRKTTKQYSGVSVMRVASGLYWLFGDLAT